MQHLRNGPPAFVVVLIKGFPVLSLGAIVEPEPGDYLPQRISL